MFMGVLICPVPEKNFNELIIMMVGGTKSMMTQPSPMNYLQLSAITMT
jgi:hypothetical protein